jgi:hypothetical protein
MAVRLQFQEYIFIHSFTFLKNASFSSSAADEQKEQTASARCSSPVWLIEQPIR